RRSDQTSPADFRQIRARRCVFHARAREKDSAGESVRKNRRRRFQRRFRPHQRRLVWRARLLVPNLLRFQRLLGHGDWAWSHLRRPFRIVFTFLIVLLGWVFFRAADLPSALAYFASMFGLGHAQPGATLLSGILYQPYYLLSIAIAALVVWAGKQTWDWTQQM